MAMAFWSIRLGSLLDLERANHGLARLSEARKRPAAATRTAVDSSRAISLGFHTDVKNSILTDM